MSEAADKIRLEWSMNDAKRDAGLVTPENVERFDDIRYGEDTKWNLLDVYRPGNISGKLPVIISVHGGGWVYGDKDLYQFYGMTLAERGFVVINFSYRLAPEAKFPASLEDMNNVISWMYEKQEEYGLNMNQVFMLGDSAGAHMLGLYTAICTDKEYAKNYPFHIPRDFMPKAIALNCGVYQPIEKDGEVNPDRMVLMQDLLPEGGSTKEADLIDVTMHINSNFPPVFVMSAKGDFMLKQVPLLTEQLKDKQIYYEKKIYGDEKNPLYHVFHITIQEPEGQKCNDDECDFFRRMNK